MPFQYLSFQRPPPRRVGPGETIAIAPLITNDLRDETFSPENSSAGISIQVAWICLRRNGAESNERKPREEQVGDGNDPTSSQLSVVKWEEPITWTGVECSWKTFTVTSPTSEDLQRAELTKNSQTASLRLALWVDQSGARESQGPQKRSKTSAGKARRDSSSKVLIDQTSIDPIKASAASQAGTVVLVGVVTPAIELRGGNETTSNEKFSEHCRLVNVVKGQSEAREIVEITEQNGYELDKHIWDASFPLKSLLATGKTVGPAKDDQSIRCVQALQNLFEHSAHDFVILELGSGTGSLSVYLHSLLQAKASSTSGCDVHIIATDLEESVEFTQSNILLNGLNQPLSRKPATVAGEENSEVQPIQSRLHIHTMPLDWYSEELPSQLIQLLHHNDSSVSLLILASDCSYNPDTYDAFASLLSKLFDTRAREVHCLVSKKHRHEDEKSLWRALESKGLEEHLIDGTHYRYRSDDQKGTESDDEEAIGSWGIFAIERNG